MFLYFCELSAPFQKFAGRAGLREKESWCAATYHSLRDPRDQQENSVRGNTTYLLLVTRVMRSFSTNPVAVGRGQKGATGAWVLAVALSRLSCTAVQ